MSLLLKKEIEYTVRGEFTRSHDSIETIFVEISKSVFKTEKNIIVACIYRPPNTIMKDFTTNLGVILEQLNKGNKTVYLLGDFNINLLSVDKHTQSSEFLELLYSYSFIPLAFSRIPYFAALHGF